MRTFILSLMAAAAIAAPAAGRTPVMPILDHIHLSVPDQAKAVEWYQENFGGQAFAEAPDRVMFGDTRLIFVMSVPLPVSRST